MKSLSSHQLAQYWQWIFPHIEGAQLQEIWTNDRLIVFEFYKFKSFWLVFDMNPSAPQLVLLQSETDFGAKKTKPLQLFLNSHAKNRRLVEGKIDLSRGRILNLKLLSGPEIEVQLIPRSVNLIAKIGNKNISWEKPRELPANQPSIVEPENEVNWESRAQEWLDFYFSKDQKKAEVKSSDRALEKKKKALEGLQNSLESDESLKWRELGDLLKSSAEIPEHLLSLYNKKENRSWNLEHAFAKAKALENKKSGTSERIKKLEEEIIELLHPSPKSEKPKLNLLKKSDKKFDSRKIQFNENLFALIGKSAKDNLEILRQAQPWCYWLHLKDYPSAHAVIFCQKGWQPQPEILNKVAEKLIAESVKSKNKGLDIKYDIVVVECRHVKPIKGDKLGRVNYHEPRVFTFASKA